MDASFCGAETIVSRAQKTAAGMSAVVLDNNVVMRFIAVVTVGKLARWLRVLGFDVSYSNTYGDDEIIHIAEEEDRVILTRDTDFAARRIRARCILIESVQAK